MADLGRSEDLLALDEVLETLSDEEPTVAEVVRLRYFGGLTIEETGAALGISKKGDKSNLPGRPEGCYAQIGLIPFF